MAFDKFYLDLQEGKLYQCGGHTQWWGQERLHSFQLDVHAVIHNCLHARNVCTVQLARFLLGCACQVQTARSCCVTCCLPLCLEAE